MSGFNLSLTKLNETQNHDDFHIFWYTLHDIPNELENYSMKFNTWQDCAIHIAEKVRSDRKILLVLVTSNSFGFVSFFDDFPQIHAIYVLDENFEETYEENGAKKLTGIFINEHALIDRLRQDILLTYRNDLPISISCLHDITSEQSLLNADGNTIMFLWNQLFIYHLVNLSSIDMKDLKEEMIEQCRLEYANDQIELEKIKDFANHFTSDTALYWYTKDSFFYRLLNKAFRTRNIDLICKFQYSIILLYQQLKLLSEQQQGENHLTVFRGQSIRKNDFEMLKANVGRLISMNTMMSTTRDRDIAHSFIVGAEIGVIFEIDTKNANAESLKPFADIAKVSSYSQEEEVLFFVGTVFLIDSINQESNSTWSIKLILQVETDKQLRKLTEDFEKQIAYVIQTPDLFNKTDDFDMAKRYYHMLTNEDFPLNQKLENMIDQIAGYIWSNLGNYEKAIQSYKNLLLKTESNDTSKLIVIHIIIGYNYFNLSQNDNALSHYGKALSLLNDNDLVKGEVYNHIGDAYSKTGYLERALSCYKQSMEYLKIDQDVRQYADLLRKIANFSWELGNGNDAIFYEERLDKINQKYGLFEKQDTETKLKHSLHELNTRTDLNLLERARLLYDIGICYIKKGEYSQALENLLQTKEFFINHPPPSDQFVREFSRLYENIALIYFLTKNYLKALAMWKKAIDIRLIIPWN